MDRKGEQTKTFESYGFTLVRNKRHQIWQCPCGHATVVTTGSRIGGRGDRNCLARIKRTASECERKS